MNSEYNKLTGLIRKAIKEYTERKWKLLLGKLGPYPVTSSIFWNIINTFNKSHSALFADDQAKFFMFKRPGHIRHKIKEYFESLEKWLFKVKTEC